MLPDRFWNKIQQTEDGCWVWTGAKRSGYGRFSFLGRTMQAHRLAYEELVGEIPERLEIDHLCRNPSCVNPEHLEPVTSQVNTLRGKGVCSANAKKTHCPKGHEYTSETTHVGPNTGFRSCRPCRADRERQRREKKKAALQEQP